jgi:hypothetical protein
MTDDTLAGSTCVLEESLKEMTCSGSHPKTKRLCSCGHKIEINIIARVLESCNVACQKFGNTLGSTHMRCNEHQFVKLNNCTMLKQIYPKKCGKFWNYKYLVELYFED